LSLSGAQLALRAPHAVEEQPRFEEAASGEHGVACRESLISLALEVGAFGDGVDMKRQTRVLADSLYVAAVAVQGAEDSLARGDLPRARPRVDERDRRSLGETLAFSVEVMRRSY
jgi:hypothetical protein